MSTKLYLLHVYLAKLMESPVVLFLTVIPSTAVEEIPEILIRFTIAPSGITENSSKSAVLGILCPVHDSQFPPVQANKL